MKIGLLPSVLLSLMVLAAFALAGGGLWLLVKGRYRKQAILMLVAAAVLAGNVAILTV